MPRLACAVSYISDKVQLQASLLVGSSKTTGCLACSWREGHMSPNGSVKVCNQLEYCSTLRASGSTKTTKLTAWTSKYSVDQENISHWIFNIKHVSPNIWYKPSARRVWIRFPRTPFYCLYVSPNILEHMCHQMEVRKSVKKLGTDHQSDSLKKKSVS